jgi:hypothetical protein
MPHFRLIPEAMRLWHYSITLEGETSLPCQDRVLVPPLNKYWSIQLINTPAWHSWWIDCGVPAHLLL